MQLIEPIYSLAFALASGPGTYALLLGSGTSRSALVPTGWEVVLDLVQRLADLQGEQTEGDPETWFRSKFGRPPEYSWLISQLAQTPAERSRIIRAYVEPNIGEDPDEAKVPQAGHYAVARLVKAGVCRVIVTTNFDPLIERALEAEGINPYVVRSPASAAGAPPLVHTAAMVIKANGDYLSEDLRNTESELESYPPELDSLLSEVFRNYGIVVCGWRGDQDIRLREQLLATGSGRYGTYWAHRGELGNHALNILAGRGGQAVAIEDFDHFFAELDEKVTSIRQLGQPPPLSSQVAVATLRRLMPDPLAKIRLAELVTGEADRLTAIVSNDDYPNSAASTPKDVSVELRRYEAQADICAHLAANLAWFGDPRQDTILGELMERLLNFPTAPRDRGAWPEMRRYPALLVLYAGGVAAVSRGRFGALLSTLNAESRRENDSQPAAIALFPGEILRPDTMKEVCKPSAPNQVFKVPTSEYLQVALRPVFGSLLPDPLNYGRQFVRFEYLLALVQAAAGAWKEDAIGTFYGGKFILAAGTDLPESNPAIWLDALLAGADEAHPLVAGPPFKGSLTRLIAVKAKVDAMVRERRAWL